MEQATLDLMNNLLKAQTVFERFRKNMKDDQSQAGAVQAFKICYELSWKIMKRILAAQGVESTAPRDIFRKAATAQLIDNPEAWFGFIEKRHLTSYTYDQENVDAIVAAFDAFSAELTKAIERMKPLVGI
jgi:nucleotidyltransferase substrate binding protein (TIGR01987 family)